MPGYLEEYGVVDARREKLLKRGLLVLFIVAAASLGLWLTFRNYRESKQVKLFFELLNKKDYKAAYALWGCTEAKPCRDYPWDSFMEDWGPKSPHADVSSARLRRTRSCSSGVIMTVNYGKGEEEYLWVERKDKTIGFAPWGPVCTPIVSTPVR